jgi:prepilin-type N-terminal cleavage/methylation domain-containing protein
MFKKDKGFTLIELLVVIAIIGTLSGIVLVSLGGARSKARDATRQSDMRQIISAQEMYYGDNEAYTSSTVGEDTTPAIGNYLRPLNDPLCSSGGACSATGHANYTWVNNTGDVDCGGGEEDYDAVAGQWFCVYALLENSGSCGTAAYVAASHHGTLIVCDNAPVAADTGCTCFH